MQYNAMAGPQNQHPTLFGHPTGLFTLFFAEMWERFSYYGMRALLLFYMLKGFLGYGDSQAYAVYGAYTALVYMTPFFGGMIADRLLGQRRAVVLGGLLMASGHLMMTVQNNVAFFTALALLIAGNGFFKPNISTMVGSLYPQGSPKRDGGFTIFYMGINLGAAMSPLLCGYIGETYGWHYGFGLATIGMLTGIAVFVAPVLLTQILIMTGAIAASLALFYFHPGSVFLTAVNVFVGVSLLAAGIVAWVALGRGGLPPETGAPPDRERLRRPVLGLPTEWLVYVCAVAAIPILAMLVSGFAPLTKNRQAVTIIPEDMIASVAGSGPIGEVAAVVLQETSKPAGLILFIAGLVALGYLGAATFRLDRIPRQRMFVVFILTFFSMLFWAFFEQAGSSVNNFTDRNVDRAFEDSTITASDVGRTIQFRLQPDVGDAELEKLPLLSQEQFGQSYGNDDLSKQIAAAIRSEEAKKKNLTPEQIEELVLSSTKDKIFTISAITYLRDASKNDPANVPPTANWSVVQSNVGMGIGGSESPASVYQALNPILILLFGIVFSALWTWMGQRGMEPSTPVKFALGLIQLGLGFGAFWYGAQEADDRGMVALSWLFIGYLLQTTGELCLSPVGLSMITKLSPAFLVSTVMGMWFLATAFSQFLAAIIAQFTGVGHGSEGGGGVPIPKETVNLYGDVFGKIAITAVISGFICLALSPLLRKWMHEKVTDHGEPQQRRPASHP
ncbi:MAG: peptide MFS transporter [Phycisphaerales bacterium]|nr:peptide MFS transporter [Phycisphaerales bacterium]MCI0629102.1 peptide MFS transporter [Phycisphaerales bacterium]MCI0675180.1 peptide MFS transporter [Phycisphaerales bacterium]